MAKTKVRAHIQGRRFLGTRTVKTLEKGLFVYRGQLWDVDDFPEKMTINLDLTQIPSHGKYEVNKKKDRKKKKSKKGYKSKTFAYLYSNLEECPDAEHTFQEVQAP